MPALAAFFLRQLVLIGVQLGIFWAIDKYITPLLNSAISSVVQKFGVSEADAEAILHNEYLTMIESFGLTVAASRAKLPLAVLDRLGIKAGNTTRKKLSAAGEAKVQAAKGTAAKTVIPTAEAIESVAKTVAQARGVSLSKSTQVAEKIIAFFGVPIGIGLLITNTIDFAAWNSSAYQGSFQRIFSVFGLTPDRQMLTSKILSQEVWDKVYNAYKLEGAVGISDPFKNQTVLFSPQALVDLVDKVAAGILVETGGATAKQVLGATHQLVIIKPTTSAAPAASSTSSGSSGSSSSNSANAPVQQIQVYTGIVAGGTLGVPSEFIARPDDMIQNTQELKAAAKNNLAAFVTALPGRFYYEIGIVSSVKSPAGFTVKGDAVRIVSGYNSNGTPRYKTVYNKFAVMKVGVRNEVGTAVKLATITLGPVNVVDFQPTNNDLQDLAGTITQEMFTSEIGDIKQINTPNNVVVNNDPVPAPTSDAPVPAMTLPPVSSSELSGLSANQKAQYDSLLSVGASPEAAYNAARLVPASGTTSTSSSSTSKAQTSTTSSSSSKVYTFAAKDGSTYKVKGTSESEAKKKAAQFAKEDGTSLK